MNQTTHPSANANPQIITWTNPLAEAATVKVSLEAAGEAPGVFSLALRGGLQQQAQQQPGARQAASRSPSQAADRRRRSTPEGVASSTASSAAGQQAVLQAGGPPATVAVAAGGALQLPVSFCPSLLREAGALLSVQLAEPAVAAPAPLVWRYAVTGVAQADTRGVCFS